jgi:hypothetical protein
MFGFHFQPSHAAVHESMLTQAFLSDPLLLKPARPVMDWRQTEPDPYNIFSVLNRNQRLTGNYSVSVFGVMYLIFGRDRLNLI